MRKIRALFLFALTFCFACAAVRQQQVETSHSISPTPTTQMRTPAPAQTPDPDTELQNEIAGIAREVNGKVGVYAVAIATGKWVGFNENDRFPMQSVVKVPISMAIVSMAAHGELRLDQLVAVEQSDLTNTNQRSPIRDANPNGTQMTIEELLKAAISESDGTASDVLQRVAGGAGTVQRYIGSLGISELNIKYSHKEFGQEWAYQYENWATPRATVDLLQILWGQKNCTDGRECNEPLLVKFMTESNNPDNRLLGLLPKGTTVAHKTGTGGTQNGVTSATNDVGIISLPDGKQIAIAVYVQDSKSDGLKPSEAIARIAKAVFDKWSGTYESGPAKAANFNDRHTLY